MSSQKISGDEVQQDCYHVSKILTTVATWFVVWNIFYVSIQLGIPSSQQTCFFFPLIGDGLTVSNQSIFGGLYIPSGTRNLLQFAIEAMAIIEIVDLPS